MKEIYKITWRDISSLPSGRWYSKEDALKEGQRIFDIEYVTVGRILEDNEKYIILASTYDSEMNENFNDVSMILKSVILKIEIL